MGIWLRELSVDSGIYVSSLITELGINALAECAYQNRFNLCTTPVRMSICSPPTEPVPVVFLTHHIPPSDVLAVRVVVFWEKSVTYLPRSDSP